MFRKYLKSLVAEVVREPLPQLAESTSRVDRLISETVPTALVHRIDNGFLVTTIDQYHSMQSQIHYCKDAKEIGEHFVSAAVKQKIGLTPESVSMKEASPVIGMRKPF
jgi:hypothetical protein